MRPKIGNLAELVLNLLPIAFYLTLSRNAAEMGILALQRYVDCLYKSVANSLSCAIHVEVKRDVFFLAYELLRGRNEAIQ